MIDLRQLREDPDRVRSSQRARGESEAAVDALLGADEQRRAAVASFEELRARQNQLGKQISAASGADRAALLTRTKELAAQVKAAQAEVDRAEQALRSAQLAVPNAARSQ